MAESNDYHFTTSLWKRGGSHATTIPPRILAYTQAPTGEDAQVWWFFDQNSPKVYVEFHRTSDDPEQFIYRTNLDTRGENSHATTVPKDILDHYDAPRGEDAGVQWHFDLEDARVYVIPTFLD